MDVNNVTMTNPISAYSYITPVVQANATTNNTSTNTASTLTTDTFSPTSDTTIKSPSTYSVNPLLVMEQNLLTNSFGVSPGMNLNTLSSILTPATVPESSTGNTSTTNTTDTATNTSNLLGNLQLISSSLDNGITSNLLSAMGLGSASATSPIIQSILSQYANKAVTQSSGVNLLA